MANMTSGGIIDAIIALVAVEAIAILLWRAKTGNGPAVFSLLCNLLAGTFLLLALRNALGAASEVWIGLCLVAAFAAHLLDVCSRWEQAPRREDPSPERRIMNATLSLRVSERKPRPAPRAQTEE